MRAGQGSACLTHQTHAHRLELVPGGTWGAGRAARGRSTDLLSWLGAGIPLRAKWFSYRSPPLDAVNDPLLYMSDSVQGPGETRVSNAGEQSRESSCPKGPASIHHRKSDHGTRNRVGPPEAPSSCTATLRDVVLVDRRPSDNFLFSGPGMGLIISTSQSSIHI